MIGSGLYHITVEMLDGIEGGNRGVMVLRDGAMRGGDSFFMPTGATRPRTATTYRNYTDETAEGDGIALAGKQKLRLLIPD
jgi:hypothetical protein